MIDIRIVVEEDIKVLALLGTITYSQSHGRFIDDKNDLKEYLETAFSVSKIREELRSPKNLFYIVYVDDLPIGYAKLVLNSIHEKVASKQSCQLERIYILDDFIPMKIGRKFLTFLEAKTKALQFDTIWLCVYAKNLRAIRFYKKNDYKKVGKASFLVNASRYQNLVFSKKT